MLRLKREPPPESERTERALNYFYDGSARLVFKGYTEDDLTITEANGEIRLILDDGVHSGSVTILAHNGTFDASDYSFI